MGRADVNLIAISALANFLMRNYLQPLGVQMPALQVLQENQSWG